MTSKNELVVTFKKRDGVRMIEMVGQKMLMYGCANGLMGNSYFR